MTPFIREMTAGVDPFLHFQIDGLRQQTLRPLPKNLRERISIAGGWNGEAVADRLVHGGVLLARVGRLGLLAQPSVHRLFHAVIHNFRLYFLCSRIAAMRLSILLRHLLFGFCSAVMEERCTWV